MNVSVGRDATGGATPDPSPTPGPCVPTPLPRSSMAASPSAEECRNTRGLRSSGAAGAPPGPGSAIGGRRALWLLTRLALLLAIAAGTPAPVVALQEEDDIPVRLLARVLPEATEYTPREGSPPVFRGFRVGPDGSRTLVGYAFYTSDVPPEEPGYNAPIEVLVGMDLRGVLTGAVVTRYVESLRRSRGDFLGRRDFQDQFAGKSIADAFRVHRDVDGISGATITVAALSLGIRNSARRVALAYLPELRARAAAPPPGGGLPPTWRGFLAGGLAYSILAHQGDLALFELALAPIPDEATGQHLLGADAFREGMAGFGGEAAGGALFLMGIDGSQWDRFRPPHLAFEQEGDTFRVAVADVSVIGPPRSGVLEGELRRAWLLRLDPGLDPSRPFTTVLSAPPARERFTSMQPGWPVPTVAASLPSSGTPPEDAAPGAGADAKGPADSGSAAGSPAIGPPPADTREDAMPGVTAGPPGAPGAASATPGAPAAVPLPALPPEPAATADDAVPEALSGSPLPAAEPLPFLLPEDEEESVLERTLSRTSWPRVGLLVALLALVLVAFRSKRARWRGVTLAATLGILGVGGGFLSVSHLISALKVGPSAFLNDLPLLLLAGFTVVSTLVWGRVFCGFLCPFGALQDALERVVPRRFRRELPPAVHRRAWWVKYGLLGVVLAPPLLGSDLSLFQYVEPFGTVFFLSPSLVLWAIALAILVASAVVPRFYCRYACPLGAALALGSTLAPSRIRRVEQCGLCTVCERACPTGAIRRERIDFRECVRCNVCEARLRERAGVCRHPMETVQTRLVRITLPAEGGR